MTRVHDPRADRSRPTGGRPPAPDPARLAVVLARLWLEVRAGRRPLRQLTPLLSPAARRRLAAQLTADPTEAPAARIRRVVATHPAPDACEATVLVERRGRTTAIAVRLERHRGAWRAVELTAPETGMAALPTASLPADHRPRDAFDEVLDDPFAPDPPGGG